MSKKGSKVRIKRSDDGDLDVTYDRTDLHNDQGIAEVGQSKDQWVNNSRSSDDSDSDGSLEKRPLKFPYPDNQTAFFIQGTRGQIRIFPSEKCLSSCKLVVHRNGTEEILSKSYSAGVAPVAAITYEQGGGGAYSWTYADGSRFTTGIFTVRPLNPAEMKKALEAKIPIVIVSDL